MLSIGGERATLAQILSILVQFTHQFFKGNFPVNFAQFFHFFRAIFWGDEQMQPGANGITSMSGT